MACARIRAWASNSPAVCELTGCGRQWADGRVRAAGADRERLPATGPRVRLGIGDDAAVTVPGGATATSVDALVDGVHFRREHATLGQIGRKALATALSDLAAMGAEPGEAYVALGIPADLDEDGCIELLDGMYSLAGRRDRHEPRRRRRDPRRRRSPWRSPSSATPAIRSSFVSRAGARPGDALVLTGEIGAAAAGLRCSTIRASPLTSHLARPQRHKVRSQRRRSCRGDSSSQRRGSRPGKRLQRPGRRR